MGWTRRRLLRAAAGAATTVLGGALGAHAATPVPAPARSPDARGALVRELRGLVTGRAVALDDPWVLMHAVLPLGPDARHRGEPILDVVARQWLALVTSGGKAWPTFPLNVEAHPNHFLEIMYTVGVPAARAFTTRVGRVTRADLYAGAKALFSPAIQGHELSWTVSVLTAEMPQGADRFENAEGRAFTVSAIVEVALQAAEAGYADTVAAMRGSKPYGRSPLQTYACNGTHVLYGILDALRHGYTGGRLAERARLLVRASIFRLGAEVRLIDQVLGAGAAPLAGLNADASKLQFVGHSLENLDFARRQKLYQPAPEEAAAIVAAERELAAVVHRIVAVHDLDALARQVPRAYAVLLGDACHALHALEGT